MDSKAPLIVNKGHKEEGKIFFSAKFVDSINFLNKMKTHLYC